jgi:adenylate cyclase
MDQTVGVQLFDAGSFEPMRGELLVGDRRERLRPRTAAVLAYLMEHRGRVVGREELMNRIWPGLVVTDDSLAQCIKEIRRALGPMADRIRTVPKVGFAFAEAPKAAPPVAVSPRRPRISVRRLYAAGIGSAIVVLVAAWIWMIDPPTLPKAFSVVVLPLATAGGDGSQDYFADAITEDLTTDLSRISGSFVIARSTANSFRNQPIDPGSIGRELGVRYLVEGNVHRSGEQVVLNLRLVDAQGAGIVWSDRIEGPRNDLEMLQRTVTGRIARSLHLELIEAEASRARRHPSANPDAHDFAMRGWSLWNRQRSTENLAAREAFHRAIELDPASVPAWAGLANTYISEITIDRVKDRAEPLRRAAEAADRAYAIDPSHANAMGSRATVLAMQGKLEESLALFRARLRQNPNYAPSHMWCGIVLTQLGEFAESAASAEQAIRLSPRDVRLPYFYTVLARARLHAGDAAAALVAAEKASQAPGPSEYTTLLVAGAAMSLGDSERARRVVAEFSARNPKFTAGSMRAGAALWRPRYREREEALIESLREAGLPAG